MSEINLTALAAPFPPEQIHWRAQNLKADGTSALALAYLDARDVMDRLDGICGAENWQDRFEVHGDKTICYLSVRIGGDWITKADGGGDTDVEGEKGALSGALKRAAVKWGIGRYLYDLGNTWVPCESYEKGGKKYWKRWTKDPWACVRNAGDFMPASAGNVTTINQPAAKASDTNAPETYITAAGFKRKKAPRLPEADATVVLDALTQGMNYAGNLGALNTWGAKQVDQVSELPDAHYDKFKLAFIELGNSLGERAA